MLYRAAATLRHADAELARPGLRAQLQLMAAATGATVSWATMTVAGPVRVLERDGSVWFEWTATVGVTVGRYEVDDNTLDRLAPAPRSAVAAGRADTTPLDPLPAE